MAAPLYFFPQIRRAQLAPDNRLSRSLLAARRLERTFADVGEATRDCILFELSGTGPGGHAGMILSVLPVSGEAPLRAGYYPEFQTWTEIAGDVPYWVGLDKEHPPMPEDLARKKIFAGYKVELAGRTWEIPVIRDPLGSSGLPMSWRRDPDGGTSQAIRPDWAVLFERFGRALWLFNDPDGPYPIRLDRGEALDLCIEALAVNYRVGIAEQNLLGLIDSENWFSVLACAVDWPTYRDVYEAVEGQKKTRLLAKEAAPASQSTEPGPESSVTSPGSPAACPATAPVTEN